MPQPPPPHPSGARPPAIPRELVPNHVALVMDVADMDRLVAAMESPEAIAAMEHDGVVASSLRILVEQ